MSTVCANANDLNIMTYVTDCMRTMNRNFVSFFLFACGSSCVLIGILRSVWQLICSIFGFCCQSHCFISNVNRSSIQWVECTKLNADFDFRRKIYSSLWLAAVQITASFSLENEMIPTTIVTTVDCLFLTNGKKHGRSMLPMVTRTNV